MKPLASVLTQTLGRGSHVEPSTIEKLSSLILPRIITGRVIEDYIRRAIRSGVWRRLGAERRALLMVASRWGVIKSCVLKQILREIFIEIEIHTLRGRAILYGIIVALKSTLNPREILNSVSRLLAIGISYLNNPPAYRFYG